MINFTYLRTLNAQNAVALKSKDKLSSFIGGGTNLVDLMKKGVLNPEKLIDINHLPFKDILKVGDTLHIGAMTSNAMVAEHGLVKQYFPLLAMAINAGASAQLRNMATTGGNLLQRTRCSYFYDLTMPCNKRNPGSGCAAIGGYNRMHAIFGASDACIAVHPSDMCIALAALNAQVVVLNAKKERKIAFKDFHRLPDQTPQKDNILEADDLIIRLEIPINKLNHSFYLKVRDRASYAFSLVSVAAALELEGNLIKDARLVMGGVAHKPWRPEAVEKFLKGKECTQDIFEKASMLAMEGAKGQGYNNFKLKLAPRTITEALNLAKRRA